MQKLPSHIGRFPILDTLGTGGMGVVYLGKDPDIGRKVAIKVLHSVSDPATLTRFKNEARTIGELSHPNIVTLLEYGVQDKQPYLVMEYLPGITMTAWRKQPHTLFEHKKVLLGLCEALGYAHQNGILHRDLKPGNVQVLPGGHAKLLDFGIARSEDTGLTATGFFIGTPKYLAPELLTGDEHSVSSDCYSLALIAYTSLCGQNPFDAGQFEAVMTKKLTVIPTPLHQLNAAIPVPLSETIMAYLQRDPKDRPQDIKPLTQALEKLVSEKVLNRRIQPLSEAQKDALSATTVLEATPRRGPRWLLPGLVLPVVALLAFFWYWQHDSDTRPGSSGASSAALVSHSAQRPTASGVPDTATPLATAENKENREQADDWPKESETALLEAASGSSSPVEKTPGEGEKIAEKTRQPVKPGPDNSRPADKPPASHTNDGLASAKQSDPTRGTAPVKRGKNSKDTNQAVALPGHKAVTKPSASDQITRTQPENTRSAIQPLDNRLFNQRSGQNRGTKKTPAVATLPDFGAQSRNRLALKPLTSTILPRGKASRLVLQLPEGLTLDEVQVMRGRRPTQQITVVRKTPLPDNRWQLNVYVEPNAVLGEYSLVGIHGDSKTKPVTLEVTL